MIIIASVNLTAGEPGGDPERSGPADTSLYFLAGWDTAFVAGTTQSGDTIAVIPLKLKYTRQDEDTISVIRFTFNYDASLELIDAYMDSSTWNGTFAIEAIGYDSVIYLEAGAINAPSDYVTCAYLKFKLKCAENLSENPITLVPGASKCEIIYGGYIKFSPDSQVISGSVANANYTAGIYIENIVAIGGIGQIKRVPVIAESNFNIWQVEHLIIFNKSLIEFIDLWPHDSSLWDDISFVENVDTIEVSLSACDSCIGNQYSLPDTLYWLEFMINCNPNINGNWAAIIYDTSYCRVAPRSDISEECSELSKSYQLLNGNISVPQYENTYRMDFACDGCDNTVSKSDSMAYVMIQMDNNFPVGDTARSIIVNFDMGDNFRDPDLTELQNAAVDYQIDKTCGAKCYASVYQVFSQNKDNYYSEIVDSESVNNMFMLELQADPASINPTSFEDKYISFDFCDEVNYGMSACTSLTWDTTGTVVVKNDDDRLHFQKDSIQVLMGEFSVDKVTGGTCSATQSLYVRNTFDLDTFSIRVHSPDLRVEINTINNSVRSGVSFSKIDDRTFDVYSTGDFSSISANGDDYTKVAEIEYTIDGACSPYQWIYIVPELSNKMMKDGAAKDQYVVLDADTLAIYCQACGSGGSSKLAWDEGQTGTLPTEFNLYPCRPNPFNPSTEVAFDVPVTCPVTICIYNILGQEVATLVDRELEAGRHSVIWNSTDNSDRTVSSGIYLCVMRAGEFTASQKMSLMK
ncbi:MAG: hypothetical protein CVT49_02315 [candidate division Zixibacteria bacterium HGW-Zixibacteria-1]|nr:MAG: hypothetical protein CVT49_02315 [candidate division Zixibacteria bacterium HGW-Zixibacteria-1]